MALVIDWLDHVVPNCRDVETTVAWYQRVLGMQREKFAGYLFDVKVAAHQPSA